MEKIRSPLGALQRMDGDMSERMWESAEIKVCICTQVQVGERGREGREVLGLTFQSEVGKKRRDDQWVSEMRTQSKETERGREVVDRLVEVIAEIDVGER